MKNRIFSMLLVLTLVIGMLPVSTVYGAETVYYVSQQNGDDGNNGTQAAPVQSLNQALELVGEEENAVIQIVDDVFVLDENNNDAPWIIDKNVTIRGNAETLPSITVRAGGMILGDDVVFENVKLGTGGFLRPGIAANGHSLTLNNVCQDETLRPLQIYGGTFIDFNNDTDYGENVRGEKSTITMNGGSYDTIYAGSANGSIELPIDILVSKGAGLTLRGIYVGSTYRDTSAGDGSIPILEESYLLTAPVNIEVIDNAPLSFIDGVNESHEVSLTVDGTGWYSYQLKDIDRLTVEGGTFALAENSVFADGAENRPEVILTGTENNHATLDISACVPYGEMLLMNAFTGSEHAILVLGRDYPLHINGTLSGEGTELRLAGGMPWGSAENPGYSGWMEYDTTYIVYDDGDGTFVIRNPYPMQVDIAFVESGDMTWTTTSGVGFMPAQIIDFEMHSQTVSYVDANTKVAGYGAVDIEVSATYDEEELFPSIGFVPLDYQITYTDRYGAVTTYKTQSSILGEDDYYYCEYTKSTAETDTEEVLMTLAPVDTTINICKGEHDLPAGSYEISATAATEDGLITRSCTLEVLPEEGDVHVHSGGTATCKDQAKCGECGEPYGVKDSNNHAGGTVVRDAKDATYTETGYTGDTYCLGCGVKLQSGKVIPVLTPPVDDEEEKPNTPPVEDKDEPVTPPDEEKDEPATPPTTEEDKQEELPDSTEQEEEIIQPISIKGAKITLSATKYTYNGKAKKPSVTVTLSGTKLKKDRDYTVKYKNNKNIGKATITITGKGKYTGSISKKFTISAKKDKTFVASGCNYKITNSSEVTFMGLNSKKTTKVKIPKTVKYGGKSFKVTAIAANALKNKSKVTSVTIGENVKTIGKCAFAGCKKLKTITIHSTKLKSVGKQAFKGIHSKACMKMPKSKLKAYKKLCQNKGQGKQTKYCKK